MDAPCDTSRRVKIVATLGPASATTAGVATLAEAGADVFRLNTAHLTPDAIGPLARLVLDAEAAIGRPLGVFCDLAGPKLRVSKGSAGLALADGQKVTLGSPSSAAAIPVDGIDPARECPPGSRVLIHDGKIILRVVEVSENTVTAEVLRGGQVIGGKGVNLPDVQTSLPSLTAHDLACLAAALDAGVSAVSLSFVRQAADVEALREAMRGHGREVPIIAKLEKAQAVEHDALAAILTATDMVMVARGDLGAETAPERVPVLQKCILAAARSRGVPAITATEMLESMIREPRPTRAEAADVANAVYDGTDAVMLSGETAVGEHPALVVSTCERIVREAEGHREYITSWASAAPRPEAHDPVADAVADAAAATATHLGAAAIVCFTQSGKTARLVARHRPERPILALTPSADVARALALVWGVHARVTASQPDDHEAVVELAEREALRHGCARSGELIVVTHGAPLAAQPLTNLMRVHRVAG